MQVRNRETERRSAAPLAPLTQEHDAHAVFGPAQWIWTTDERKNQYAAFARSIRLAETIDTVNVRISASYHYELYLDGGFVNRGPVHGDPQWCHYDDLEVKLDRPVTYLDVLIVVHHPTGTHVHCLMPAPGGLVCRIEAGSVVTGTDPAWRCLILPMWSDRVPERNWALGYCEDYDARLEPQGWQSKRVSESHLESWDRPVVVGDAAAAWGRYQARVTPLLHRRRVEPVNFTIFRAPGPGSEAVFDVSDYCDREELTLVERDAAYSVETLNAELSNANAFTLDLGREYVGFYHIELDAPAGTVVELSGAELLQPGNTPRPWIFRKGSCYSVRYTCAGGQQAFTSFSWSGFRYVHVVIRSAAEACTILSAGATERTAELSACRRPKLTDPRLAEVSALCERTLEVAAQEHLVDCPTREQSPAWPDSLIIAAGLLKAFCEPSYLLWYLEAFLRAPLNEHGLFGGRYPSPLAYWIDFCLIAIRAQEYYRGISGRYYKPGESYRRGADVKKWYDGNTNADGIIDFPFEEYYKQGFRNFVDHPGLGMHDSPHPGIDRDGASCPLNIHYYAYLRTLSGLAEATGHAAESAALARQADALRRQIRRWFFDGEVFHDAKKAERLSPYTSWQTNGIAVYYDIAEESERRTIMQRMLDGYHTLCRCTPYTHYYFLPALQKSGMREEALELIKREWGLMIEAGATTAWEGFQGDAKDSLCHPWATTPLLYLLESEPVEAL